MGYPITGAPPSTSLKPGDDAASLGSGSSADSLVLTADGAGGAAWESVVGGGGGTVTSVAVSGSDGIQVDSGSPITASGTIALGVDASTLATHLGLNSAAYTVSTDYAGASHNQAASTISDSTATGRALLTAATVAAAQQAIDVEVGVDVLAYSASTGTGNLVRASSPTLVTPALGTPSSGTLANCSGLPASGISDSTSTGRAVLTAATVAAAQQAVDLEPGVDIQAYMPDGTQLEMEAGTEPALRAVSPLRIAQAIAALAGSGSSGITTVYSNDYVSASTGTTAFNGATVTYDGANTRVSVSNASLRDKGATFSGVGTLAANSAYMIAIDITVGSQSIDFRVEWSGVTLQRYLISKSGKHYILFKTDASPGQPMLVGTVAASDTFYINDVVVYSLTGAMETLALAGIGAALSKPLVLIGELSYAASATTDGIAIGKSAYTGRGAALGVSAFAADGYGDTYASNASCDTAIGHYARATTDTTWSASAAGGPRTAIGSNAIAASWRATAVGANTIAGATSATVVGCGGFANQAHQTVIGRGAIFAGSLSDLGAATNLGGDAPGSPSVFFANGWAHQFDTPPTGITVSSFSTPANREIKLHGQDAFDARASVSSTNVAAGHLALYAGRGTGTGDGGEVRVYTAPQAGVGSNTKNTAVLAAKFDSDTSTTGNKSRFLLLDTTTSTLRRVEFGAADSGGTGYRMLRVAN